MSTRWQSGLHHPVSIYAKQVVRGTLHDQCCPYEIKACQRHLDDLKRQDTEGFPFVFDTTRADRIIRWFSLCVQSRGPDAGKPVTLEPWQVFDLGCVYGWVHAETGARRFTLTYNKRARGNYKSTEKSCQALYHMCADAIYPPYQPELARYESQPEIECAAVDGTQAQRVFGDCREIALKSPKIARRLNIPRSETAKIKHKTLGGYIRKVSKDTKNLDSGAPCYVVIDEYHAHPTSAIYDVEKSAMGKRAQSLMDVITTAGDDAQRKPCYREEEYAKKVLDGDVIAEHYFVMIRELPPKADPHDKSLWSMANPCLRYESEYARTLLRHIEEDYVEAYGSNDPDKIRNFLIRRMCRWAIGAVTHYLDEYCMQLARDAMIDKAAFAQLTDGLEAWCGYDLGKRIDLSGVGAVLLLPDGRVAVKMHGFLPEGAATRHEHTDRVPYLAWAADGYCTLTPGDVTDNSFVADWIADGVKTHNWRLQEIDYDGHNATDLAIALRQEYNNEDICVEIAQTCNGQNIAVKGFRDLLLSGKIVIEYSPLVLWCLANAVEVVNNFGDIKLSKRHKDDTERIDPVAATMNALARALVRQQNPTLADRIAQSTWSM